MTIAMLKTIAGMKVQQIIETGTGL